MDSILDKTPTEALEITLRPSDDFDSRYDNNPDNELKSSELRKFLSSSELLCFFQKQKPDAQKNRPRHKIIIPLGKETAIEIGVSLRSDKLDVFTELHSYQISKIKETKFFVEPSKNTIKKLCTFKFASNSENAGTNSNGFKFLFQEIESNEVPMLDINKQIDMQIWKNYVNALKKLVKDKEQVWKIDNITAPYMESREGESERATYVDIFINEKDLIEKLEKGIFSLFRKSEIEDHGIGEEKAFIEFKNYRELASEELASLKTLGEELFYDLSAKPVTHAIAGKIELTYSENTSKEHIYGELMRKLQNEYQLECPILADGMVEITDRDLPHLQKLITEYYKQSIFIEKVNDVLLSVTFPTSKDPSETSQNLMEKLIELSLDRAKVSYTKEGEYLVEVSAHIDKQIFASDNMVLVRSISRFKVPNGANAIPLNGFTLIDGIYHIQNTSRQIVESGLKTIQNQFPGKNIRRLPTQYFFKQDTSTDITTLRNFKTFTDQKEKTEFIISQSAVKVSADSADDFSSQILRIKKLFPSVSIEEKEYKPAYILRFKMDLEDKREKTLHAVVNSVRKSIGTAVHFDFIKKHTTALFSYQFLTPEDRDNFKEAINQACSEYAEILNVSFDNSLGRSTYELIKNETLEIEKEKEVRRNISQATFIYLTPAQREQLNEQIKKYGAEAFFKEGVTIGRLVRKEKNKLRFKITDTFDEMINGREKDRISLEEIRKGFIKPIFPGEMTNVGRMIKAMKKVTEPSSKNGFPVNPNLSNFLFDPNEARQSLSDLDEEKEKVAANLNEPFLSTQPKQLEAVAKTLLARDLSLIQGPPGTGKTTVIAEIIWQTLIRENGSKLLITSQTNLAVDNALERIKGKKLVRPLRIGNIEKFEDEGKVYSNERIRNWSQANSGSNEEKRNSDNAVCSWIDTIISNCTDESKYADVVSKWKIGLESKSASIKKTFTDAYLKHVNVFAATCSECGSKNFGEAYQATFHRNSDKLNDPVFDLVIMDEASKATPPELVMPLILGKKVVIIGDHKQLPPMIDEKEFGEALEAVGAKKLIEDWTKEDYKVSQFEKLFKNAPKNFVTSLDTQFRMHEQIMNCISQFYTDQQELENGLLCGIKGTMDIPDFSVKSSRWHGLSQIPFIEPKHHAIWVNVESPEEKIGTSYENMGEIEAIKLVLKALKTSEGFDEYTLHAAKDEEKEIGIITYYMPQMTAIRKALYPTLSRNEWRNFEQYKLRNEYNIPLRINTVDRFQGMERNIIIISTVRSNKQYKIEKGKKIPIDNNKYPFALGFARELQRINVGFSRAKRLLIVIGNEKHFAHKSEYEQAIQKMHRIDISQLNSLVKK
ncbi:AAA domain-containing protein [Sphingobacterium corticibacterium]|uniref:AAA+ ATPase domain-containing protein n=1 Tax=Sphingobacterium corticibacterium TaxID=2484746 RepID=A0A4Q6XMX3_9SPHI|nr:AAA domain-containing protein [Sphingobacterium corticibacterium]RZF57879.1 hypothetical protein EWE74_19605 [Sphingobacterium corticibacterium]